MAERARPAPRFSRATSVPLSRPERVEPEAPFEHTAVTSDPEIPRGSRVPFGRSLRKRKRSEVRARARVVRVAPSLQQLAALRTGLTSRQVPIRESLFAQRSLLELLVSHIETRAAYAQAWVDLAYAAGLPLAGASP